MIFETVELRKKPINGFMPTMTVYAPYDSLCKNGEISAPRKTPAVVICPGGGYAMRSAREAEPIAMMFCAAGIKAFVVDYSINPSYYPEPLIDVSEAVKCVRSNAEKWGVNPNQIAVCGFSAGGHLAASLGTLWNQDANIKQEDESNKPNALILGYPVIMWDKNGHVGSFYNLLGDNLPETEYEKMSLEKRVTKDTPPTFLWHTVADSIVPVENSLEFAKALRHNGVPFEMHIYPLGEHGLSLADASVGTVDPHAQSWVKLVCEWLQVLFG